MSNKRHKYFNKVPPFKPDPEHYTRKQHSWKAKEAYETEDDAWEYLNQNPKLKAEGMTVYSVASQSINSGITLALGVALHNIPMGALIYSTLESESRGKRNSILLLSSFSTFFGGLLMMALSSILSPSFFIVLMSLALGMVMYILFW